MNPNTPTAVDRIDELKRLICEQVPVLIDEARDNITEAITATMEEAQEKEEGKAVLSLAITAKWDLDGCAVVVSMPVNVRRKYEVTAMMDDPSQPPLPFDGGAETSHADAASLRKGIQAVDRALAAGLTPDDVSMAIKLAKASKAGVRSTEETMQQEGGAS
jgi:hypothetical protein